MPDVLLTRDQLLIYAPKLSSVPTATVNAYIDAASRTVEKICAREFLNAEVTERHPYPIHPKLWLRRPPVTCVESVSLYYSGAPILMDQYGSPIGPDYKRTSFTETRSETLVGYSIRSSQNAAVLDLECSEVRVWSPQIARSCFYEVTYEGGFDETPDMIKIAISKMVEDINDQFTGGHDIQSERIGDYAYSKFATKSGSVLSGFVGGLLSGYIWRAI